jgi:D-lactate dehydrogenase (cytochrome)
MNNYHQYSEKLIEHALKLNGTCTGEHGVGLGKKKYLLNQFGTEALEIMKSIKKTFDPNNILNPNKIFI